MKTIKFVLTIDVPDSVLISQLKQYIEDSFHSYCGGFSADDNLFRIGDSLKSVQTATYRVCHDMWLDATERR